MTCRGDGLRAHAGNTDSSACSGTATKPYRLTAPSKPYHIAAAFSAKPSPTQSAQVTHPSAEKLLERGSLTVSCTGLQRICNLPDPI